jgi:hypothetical protein
MSVLILSMASYPPISLNESLRDENDVSLLQIGSLAFAQEISEEELAHLHLTLEQINTELSNYLAGFEILSENIDVEGDTLSFTTEARINEILDLALFEEKILASLSASQDLDVVLNDDSLDITFEKAFDEVVIDGKIFVPNSSVTISVTTHDDYTVVNHDVDITLVEIDGDAEIVELGEEEIEIEVEVKTGKTIIKIEFGDEEYKFVIKGDPTDEEIISAIVDKTGLEPLFITSIWEFESEAEDEELESSIDVQAKIAERMAKKEMKAQEKAEETILELQQKIDQLEQRLQNLIDRFETGEYFGIIPVQEPVTTSFSISFAGSATSLNDDSIVTDVDGEIFLETLVTSSDSTKFRITGGDLLVGDTFYDFVIGKARASSSGTSGEKDSMLILGEVIDDEGNVSTIKILIDAANLLSGDFLEPIDLELLPQSKIAKQWSLSASGQLFLLQG